MQPVIILEKETTTGKVPLTKNDLNHFSIARTPEQVRERGRNFSNPIMTADKAIVHEALKIESLFN